jgi:excisionase family DNA binding protein
VNAYTRRMQDADPLLTAGEVARLFKVNTKTPGRWARAGLVASVRTPGGHRRFRRSVIRELLERDERPQ